MTPDERQLITGLFDRMRGFVLTRKDSEAEALIRQQVSDIPDAPYMLVQSVLVQEHALQQADSRIKELEEKVRALEEAQQQRAAPATGAGSFLGGLFGSRATPEPGRSASVPAIGARATPSAFGSGRSAWAGPQAGTQQPGPMAGPQAGGGGFLQSAMATAAGVAGGMLAASAISSLLGGGTPTGTPTATSTPPTQPTSTEPTTPAPTEPTPASQTGEGGEGQSYHDASYDDDGGGWFGGGDEFDL